MLLTDTFTKPASAGSANAVLPLEFGMSFPGLYDREALVRLDAAFLKFLAERDAALHARLLAARVQPDELAAKVESELLLALAPHLDDFLARLFGIESEVRALATRHHELAPLYTVKRLFVQRKAMHKIKPAEAEAIDGPALEAELAQAFGEPFSELAFARHVTDWQKDEAANAARLEQAVRYAAWAALTPGGRKRHHGGVLFKAPAKLDPQRLVPVTTDESAGYKAHRLGEGHLRRREGFKLTDPGTDLAGALDETNYCIWCHEQGKDSCSKGLLEKGGAGKGAASFKKSPFGVILAGCPLGEKISEFQKAKSEGIPDRRPRHYRSRQSDGGSDRAPHLQRLHEVVHLPEAGAGQHSAGRNPHPEGCAGAAVGIRDLFTAHALESAQSAHALSQGGDRQARARGRHGPGRVGARPIT